MNIISGFEKGLQAVGSALVDASQSVVDGVQGSVDTWMKKTGAEFDDVGQAFREGKLLHAGAEFAELMSPGVHVSNALDAIGILDANSVDGNRLSGWINGLAATGSPLALLATAKDLCDLNALKRSIGTGEASRVGIAHVPPCPDEVLADAGASQKRGYARGDRIPSSRPVELSGAMERLCLDPQGRQFCIQILERRWNIALAELPWSPEGPSCRHKPLAQRTTLDILNDSSLCFEDKVAMFMAKVMDDMEEQVTRQMKKIASLQGQGARDAASNNPSVFKTQYKFVKDSLAAGDVSENIADDLFQQALRCIRPALPAISAAVAPAVGTAVGAAIGSVVPGAGTAIGGAIGGIVSTALPAVLPALFDLSTQSAANEAATLSKFGRDAAAGVGNKSHPESSAGSVQMEMERLKLLLQRMQQMQQAYSNVLNAMHNGTMNVVRNIR